MSKLSLSKCVSFAAGISICLNVSAAVVIAPTNLSVFEGGSSSHYQVVLDSPPLANEFAIVTPESLDQTEVTVSGILVFDSTNWFIPQYVAVSPVDDGVNDGDQLFSIVNTVASNISDGNYDQHPDVIVSMSNFNTDSIGVVAVNPSSGIFMFEGDTQEITVSVVSSITPQASVFIEISNFSSNLVDDIPSVLVLNSANNFSTSFSVSVPSDETFEAQESFTVELDSSQCTDSVFNALNVVDINGYILTDDPQITFVDGFE